MATEQLSSPVFEPLAFFDGATEGRGSLKVMFKARQPTHVIGHGVTTADGGIALDQEIRRGGSVTRRTWRLHRTGANGYTGTLTDAISPVEGNVVGNRLHLRFTMKGGLRVQQWLYLQPGARIARNRMVVTKLGVPVASLDETIARLAPGTAQTAHPDVR